MLSSRTPELLSNLYRRECRFAPPIVMAKDVNKFCKHLVKCHKELEHHSELPWYDFSNMKLDQSVNGNLTVYTSHFIFARLALHPNLKLL